MQQSDILPPWACEYAFIQFPFEIASEAPVSGFKELNTFFYAADLHIIFSPFFWAVNNPREFLGSGISVLPACSRQCFIPHKKNYISQSHIINFNLVKQINLFKTSDMEPLN